MGPLKPSTTFTKTIYNPYQNHEQKAPKVTSEDQENMKTYLENLHGKNTTTDLQLKCNNCNLTFTIRGTDKQSTHFMQHYGKIDKVTGRVFEFNCPQCIGVMEKIVN